MQSDRDKLKQLRELLVRVVAGLDQHLEATAGVLQERRGLAYQRKAAGLSQAQVAAAIGTTQAYYSRLERGKHEPRPETMLKLAALFRVPVSALD